MNKDILRHNFTDNEMPNYPCPFCQKYSLNLIDIKCFKEFPYKSYEDGSFNGSFQCINCSNYVQFIGHALINQEQELDRGEGYSFAEKYVYKCYNDLSPQYFYPQINLFPIDEKIPEKIKTCLEEASKLYFSDYTASSNKIRKVIEAILDCFSETEEERSISLHHKILEFENKNPRIGRLMMSIKYIGNSGSHYSEKQNITKLDLMNSFIIVNDIIDELFIISKKNIDNLADDLSEKFKKS